MKKTLKAIWQFCSYLFVPQWGRNKQIADSDNFNGDIAERDCNHHLLPGETFDFCYRIQVF